MFDLEKAITNWRRGLETGPLAEEAIDELESHLRDEIDRRLREGQTESQALAAAVDRLGEIPALQREFAMGDRSLGARVRRTFKGICAFPPVECAGVGCGDIWRFWTLRLQPCCEEIPYRIFLHHGLRRAVPGSIPYGLVPRGSSPLRLGRPGQLAVLALS